MKKVGDTMLKEWLRQGRARRPGRRRRVPQVSRRRRASEQLAAARRALDALYDGAGYLAALFMIGLLADGAAVASSAASSTSTCRGTDAYAGYCMAAAGFLALAHTLKRGEHIRVTLLLEHAARPRAPARSRSGRWPPATLLAALFACYSVRLAWQSLRSSTTSPPATTRRRCGSRSSRWRSARWCCSIAFVDELRARAARQARRRAEPTSEALRNE